PLRVPDLPLPGAQERQRARHRRHSVQHHRRGRRLTAFCLGCGARHGEDEPCACAAEPYRSVPRGPRLGACPSCGQPLVDELYADTPVEECLACGGIFLDGSVLDLLTEAKEQRRSLAISLPVRDL